MKTTITYTYWMELRTGMIYKYEIGMKPYKALKAHFRQGGEAHG